MILLFVYVTNVKIKYYTKLLAVLILKKDKKKQLIEGIACFSALKSKFWIVM